MPSRFSGCLSQNTKWRVIGKQVFLFNFDVWPSHTHTWMSVPLMGAPTHTHSSCTNTHLSIKHIFYKAPHPWKQCKTNQEHSPCRLKHFPRPHGWGRSEITPNPGHKLPLFSQGAVMIDFLYASPLSCPEGFLDSLKTAFLREYHMKQSSQFLL